MSRFGISCPARASLRQARALHSSPSRLDPSRKTSGSENTAQPAARACRRRTHAPLASFVSCATDGKSFLDPLYQLITHGAVGIEPLFAVAGAIGRIRDRPI